MIVLTLGSFDLFHTGHVHLLRRCRDLASLDSATGRVVVALNTDEFIARYKGHAPVVGYEDREWVLWSSRYVDIVIPNVGNEDAKPAILAAGPDIIAIGSDWMARDYLGQLGVTQAWLDGKGIRVVYLPYTEGISSTAIRERIA